MITRETRGEVYHLSERLSEVQSLDASGVIYRVIKPTAIVSVEFDEHKDICKSILSKIDEGER